MPELDEPVTSNVDSNLEYIYEHYVESSDGSFDLEDHTDDTTMMHAVLENAKHAEKHVLNFKGSIKTHQVLNHNRTRDHLTLMDDYFVFDALLLTLLAGPFG
ncbi:putative glutathione S-transferase GSTU6 [Hordeum vulgare]|nr:putative glutathione S-transferase GSTU6 [Hordeum vulgare]